MFDRVSEPHDVGYDKEYPHRHRYVHGAFSAVYFYGLRQFEHWRGQSKKVHQVVVAVFCLLFVYVMHVVVAGHKQYRRLKDSGLSEYNRGLPKRGTESTASCCSTLGRSQSCVYSCRLPIFDRDSTEAKACDRLRTGPRALGSLVDRRASSSISTNGGFRCIREAVRSRPAALNGVRSVIEGRYCFQGGRQPTLSPGHIR